METFQLLRILHRHALVRFVLGHIFLLWHHACRPGNQFPVYFPLILICVIATLGGLSVDMATQWTGTNYAAYEYGIHPDIPTGKPIMFTGAVGYPQYYVPKLNGIVFAFGLQTLVELSPLVQRLLSLKVFTFAFRHIFAIYLIHGFVFWSLGSTIFVFLAKRNVDYWKMVVIVGVCCYSAMFLALPILTTIVRTLGKSVPHNIWEYANEPLTPRRPTMYPFPPNFLFIRTTTQNQGPVTATAQEGEKDMEKSKPPNTFKNFFVSKAAALDRRLQKPVVPVQRIVAVRST
jgi:hypothetical protein